MFFDLALALMLITAPTAEPVPDEARALMVRAQALAVELELLDARERSYVFTRSEDLAGDVRLIRRRWHELKDAPPLHDHLMFPDRHLINELLSFNRVFKQHLDARQGITLVGWWENREAAVEADRLYVIWDTARDARCDYYYVSVRRQALKKLRDVLGSADYHGGRLPCHVPVGVFGRCDP